MSPQILPLTILAENIYLNLNRATEVVVCLYPALKLCHSLMRSGLILGPLFMKKVSRFGGPIWTSLIKDALTKVLRFLSD